MRWLALVTVAVLLVPSARVQEDAELIAKQKKAADTVMKKVALANPALIETTNLIVCGGLPEDKLKAMGEALQKTYATTLKALRFEMLENPPKGKLIIYFFPERKVYGLFVGDVVADRLEKDERSHYDSRGQEPYLAVSVLPGEKPTDLDAEAIRTIPAVLLQAKAGGARLPTWMTDGFVRAMKWRLDPKSAAEKTAARRLITKYKAADIWMPPIDKEKQLAAALLMEYFAFGIDAAKTKNFLNAFRQNEGDPAPNIMTALMGIDLTPDTLDPAWKKWVTTGKTK